MDYIDLNSEAITNSKGAVDFRILEEYCTNIDRPVRYIGYESINTYTKFPSKGISFKNLVYASAIISSDICYEFPDLVSADLISYYVGYFNPLNICNLKKINTFYINHNFHTEVVARDIIHEQIVIIDENTLIINGKKLIVEVNWGIFGLVSSSNYANTEFY